MKTYHLFSIDLDCYVYFSEDHKDWFNGKGTENGLRNLIHRHHLMIITIHHHPTSSSSIFITASIKAVHHHDSSFPSTSQVSSNVLELLLLQNVVAKYLAWIHYWNDMSFWHNMRSAMQTQNVIYNATQRIAMGHVWSMIPFYSSVQEFWFWMEAVVY